MEQKEKMTYEQQMKELKKGLSAEEILSNEKYRVCNFSEETIRDYAVFELNEMGKQWRESDIDILVQVVEGSDWLKIHFDTEELSETIVEWIHDLEEEWEESEEEDL